MFAFYALSVITVGILFAFHIVPLLAGSNEDTSKSDQHWNLLINIIGLGAFGAAATCFASMPLIFTWFYLPENLMFLGPLGLFVLMGIYVSTSANGTKIIDKVANEFK